MIVPNLSLGGHGPSSPVDVPQDHLQASNASHSPSSFASSSSTIGRDGMVYGASPHRTLQEAMRANVEQAKRSYASIENSLNELASLAPEQRLSHWRKAYDQSKMLAFEDSGSLHRDAVAQIIANIGHLQDSPSESELRDVFHDALFEPVGNSPRDVHEPTEDAMSLAIGKLPDAISKIVYVNNMLPVMHVASLEQQGAFLRILIKTMNRIKNTNALSEGDLNKIRSDTSSSKLSAMLRTVRHYAGAMDDTMYYYFSDLDTFATPEIRAEVLAQSKQYPQRSVSARLVANAHTA